MWSTDQLPLVHRVTVLLYQINKTNPPMECQRKKNCIRKLRFLRIDQLLEIVHTWCWLWFAICGFLANIVPEVAVLVALVGVGNPVGTAE